MIRLAEWALRRPKLTLGIWLAAVLVLSGQAKELEARLAPANLVVPGTGSAEALELSEKHFGPTVTVPVLLRGPRADVKRQGMRLAAALSERRGGSVVTPWGSAGRDARRLRPDARTAMIVATFRRPVDTALEVAAEVERVSDRVVQAPVTAHPTGQAVIGRGLERASLDSARAAEKIAVPALMVVLVLVFGSFVAASVPVLFGGATVLAGLGLVSIVAQTVDIEPLAVSLASMMGLALGVDYSLFIVSRFREQLAAEPEADPARVAAAATASVMTAGRTVLSAGAALVAAMGAILVLAPGNLLFSAAVGSGIVVILSVLSAVVVVPALLAVLGDRVNRGRIRRSSPDRPGRLVRGARRAIRRPGIAALAILVLLFGLAMPAAALDPGGPGVAQLPESDQARQDFELLNRSLGEGWAAPFEVIVAAPEGSVTARRRLAEIARLQRRLAKDPEVAMVLGPGAVERRVRGASRVPRQLGRLDDTIQQGDRDLRRLSGGLGRAGTGLRSVRSGFDRARAGADRLSAGAEEAADGQRSVRAGLEEAAAGAREFTAGLRRARRGARRLERGGKRLDAGTRRLRDGVVEARTGVERAPAEAQRLIEGLERARDGADRLGEPARIATQELGTGFRALRGMTAGKLDPRYREATEAVGRALGAASGRNPLTGEPVAEGYDGLETALGQLETGLGEAVTGVRQSVAETRRLRNGLVRLEEGAEKLTRGLGELQEGQASLGDGLVKLTDGSTRLPAGLRRLQDGTARLGDGLDQLARGARRLGGGLGGGFERSAELQSGVGQIRGEVGEARKRLPEAGDDARVVQTRSPGFFRSGYLTLALLDGAPAASRDLAELVVNVRQGGQAGRILVIPRRSAGSPETQALYGRLVSTARRHARDTGTRTAVGGEGAIVNDFEEATSARVLPLITALSLISILVLIPILRAPVLAVVTVLLTLLTVAASFGAMVLLLQGDDPLLGGPGYISSIAVIGIFAVVFALSIDYVVFLVGRMREGYERTGDPDIAIDEGVSTTGRVITGAAAIMISVFVAFAMTDFSGISEFGVGLAVAVALDATLIRLVLLPAIMRMLGRWSWWTPQMAGRPVAPATTER